MIPGLGSVQMSDMTLPEPVDTVGLKAEKNLSQTLAAFELTDIRTKNQSHYEPRQINPDQS